MSSTEMGIICQTKGCGREVRCKGLCKNCYSRSLYSEQRFAKQRHRKQRYATSLPMTGTCGVCGAHIVGPRSLNRNTRYCSQACARRAWHLANRRGPGNVRLDRPTLVGARLVYRHESIGWVPAGFDAVEDVIDIAKLASSAAICPADWKQRLARGELRIVVDDHEVRFVVLRTSREAVPWHDFAGPIPSMAIMSAGKMRGHATSRKQKVKIGRKHSRPDKKSKAAA